MRRERQETHKAGPQPGVHTKDSGLFPKNKGRILSNKQHDSIFIFFSISNISILFSVEDGLERLGNIGYIGIKFRILNSTAIYKSFNLFTNGRFLLFVNLKSTYFKVNIMISFVCFLYIPSLSWLFCPFVYVSKYIMIYFKKCIVWGIHFYVYSISLFISFCFAASDCWLIFTVLIMCNQSTSVPLKSQIMLQSL